MFFSLRQVLQSDRDRATARAHADPLPFPEPADVLPTPRLLRGDEVLTADGRHGVVERVGWHGEPSPYVGDDILRAFVYSATWEEGARWCDWLPVYSLVPVAEGDKQQNAPAVAEAL